MTRSEYQRLIPLFEAAMKLPAWRRRAFAREHCGDDPQLFHDLLQLLLNAEQAAETLDWPVARVPAPKARRSQQGLVVEGFKVIRPIGRGGMGKVFEAVDRKTGARVAIKFIQTRGAFSVERRLLFLLEARGMASMRHPHIVELYDIGQVQGHLYLVMEYLEGRSLRSWLGENPSDRIPSTLRIVSQTARALAFAHSQGFVHGDVKPENIMVLQDGSPKLIDFGLARHGDLPGSPGLVGGTPPYMDPELFQKPAPVPGAASDVWSLGVTLLECLTGRLPFQNPEQARSAAHHRLPNDMPLAEQLNSLIDQVLNKKTEERVKSAEVVAAELERLGVAYPNASTVVGTSTPAADEAKRKAYAPPDLGLRSMQEGPVETKMRVFSWRRRQRRLTAWPEAMITIVALGGILPMELALGPGDFLMFLAGLCWLVGGFLVLFLPSALCSFFCAFEERQFCAHCRLAMRSTSAWTRFANEKTEVVYGQGDCIATLKHGLWHEAAKLISIHGKEVVAAYCHVFLSPARFRLEFFECEMCGDQAARLTVEEVEDNVFRPQPDYFEAYRPNAVARARLSASAPGGQRAASSGQRRYLVHASRHIVRTLRALRRIEIHSGVLTLFFIAIACVVAQMLLTWHHDPLRMSPITWFSRAPVERYPYLPFIGGHQFGFCVVEPQTLPEVWAPRHFRPVTPKSSGEAEVLLENFTCRESEFSASQCRVYCTKK